MGGSYSEPATLGDLGTRVNKLYENKKFAKYIGFYVEGYSVDETIQGAQVVDDVLLASRLLCANCMLDGMKKLWPRDVGVSKEEEGENHFYSPVY